MWGESSENCENNCQCSGLITENFKINSGSNATKRKQETAFRNNYKLKMNPHSLDFASPSHSPKATPSKRRVLGEIQNFKPGSPLIDRLKSPMSSPVNSPFKSPLNLNPLNIKSPMIISPLKSLASPLLNSPIIASHSPLTSRLKRSSKISKIFEERTRFKMENKENERSFSNCYDYKEDSYKKESYNQDGCQQESYNEVGYKKESYSEGGFDKDSFVQGSFEKESYKEDYLKFDLEETARDFSFGEKFQASRERNENWSSAKLDFTDAIPTKSSDLVPEQSQDLDDLESLHDLEVEFENETFEQCTKYEIISTDSPDVISRGRSTSRKICSRNFEFGAPLAESEPSTSFNRPATRMLNFDDEDFEFTSPVVKKPVSVKKSLKFNETPTKNTLRQRSDSSIGSMSSSPTISRVFTSESTASMESGFISELEEPFLDIEESNSPKIANFDDLLSGQIKDNVLTDKSFMRRPTLARSLSFHPESKARISLLSILESPSEEKRKREESELGNCNKRRRSNCDSIERVQRPVLHRAASESNASIKSALARSSVNSDLIGDYSGGYLLPLTRGDHEDLKSISCDTLAALLSGDYRDTVPDYQVIDCRYPYEFEGGHIASAVNLYTSAQVQALVQHPPPPPPHLPPPPPRRRVLVLHCEFSIERGPKLSRALRSFDRSTHRAHYPALAYPELYLLHGGYRAFHRAYPEHCTPAGYTPMLDPQHKHLLRRHRSLQGRNRLLL